nr:serine/threonine-protein kinase pim-2-like [Danio rerio]|eukprot:XP_021332628.1 serine/threonine-protein kinase pim-2-like [Danio rerio]
MLKEVAYMLRLQRPPLCKNVIQMYEWFEEPGSYSLVMEYPKPCESLWDFVSKQDKLTEPVARGLVRQIVLAVQHCIDKGVAHNDLHGNNILVNTRTRQIKLIDFGRAYKVESGNYKKAVFTSTRAIGYLLCYMVTGDLPNDFDNAKRRILLTPGLTNDCCKLIKKSLSQTMTLKQFLQYNWMK